MVLPNELMAILPGAISRKKNTNRDANNNVNNNEKALRVIKFTISNPNFRKQKGGVNARLFAQSLVKTASPSYANYAFLVGSIYASRHNWKLVGCVFKFIAVVARAVKIGIQVAIATEPRSC